MLRFLIFMDITVEKAGVKDAAEILSLQRSAFLDEAEVYKYCKTPPLGQSIDSLKEEFSRKTFIKAVTDDTIVGSVRAFVEKDTCYIEKLMVAPSFQRRGIGTRLVREIEDFHGEIVEKFQLATNKGNPKSVGFYKKLGYRPFKTREVSDDIGFVFLQKHLQERHGGPEKAFPIGPIT